MRKFSFMLCVCLSITLLTGAEGLISGMQDATSQALSKEFGEPYYQASFVDFRREYHPVARAQSQRPCVLFFDPPMQLDNGIEVVRIDSYPESEGGKEVRHLLRQGELITVICSIGASLGITEE